MCVCVCVRDLTRSGTYATLIDHATLSGTQSDSNVSPPDDSERLELSSVSCLTTLRAQRTSTSLRSQALDALGVADSTHPLCHWRRRSFLARGSEL